MSRIQDTTDISVERGPFEMIPHWLLDTEVSSHAVRLYLILRRHGNDRGVCFPGRKRLANQLHVSTSTIDRARAELSDAGAICYRTRVGTDGDYTSNEYHVHWTRTAECGFYFDEGYPAGDDTPPADDDTGVVTGDELTNTHKEPIQTKVIDRFDEFWQAYPKKVAKPKARQLWLKVIKKHNRQMLIDAARSYANDPKRDPDFTLNPTTWLSQERWTDEPPQAAKPSGPVTILNMYADEPCEHGDPMGESRCALCRRK